MEKSVIRKWAGQVYSRVFNFVTMWRKLAMAIAVERGWVQSDEGRWAKLSSLNPEWDERTKEIVKLIPEDASVLEFGAGRMTLKKLLPSGCKYTPSDIVDRGEGTIVCDLNAPELPAFPPHDVAVLGGVLEYVVDVPRLAASLAGCCPTVILTYCVASSQSSSEILRRRMKGWSNDFLVEDIERVFNAEKYACSFKKQWRSLLILKFDLVEN